MNTLSMGKNVLVALTLVFIVGCTGAPIQLSTVKGGSTENIDFETGRDITAEASGFQLLLFIPININDRHARAYSLLESKASGDYISNVQVKESWTYGFVGTVYTTTITAKAYPNKKG